MPPGNLLIPDGSTFHAATGGDCTLVPDSVNT
jgi:hypothetical protein